jgi:PAS domain S-box-containing protein
MRRRFAREVEPAPGAAARGGSEERQPAAGGGAGPRALGLDGMLLLKAVEHLPNKVFVKDADELRFVFMNREGEALLGVPRGELLGKSDHDILPAEQADFFIAKDREVLASGVPMVIPEEQLLSPARGLRFLRTYKVCIGDDAGRARYLLGVSVDITDIKRGEDKRREAERALARREARFRSLIESATDLIIVADAQGTISYAGPSHERVLGYDPETLRASKPFELVHPDDRDKLRAAGAAVLEEPTARPMVVYRLRHADGSWRTLESTFTNALANPDIAGIVINSRDITDQLRLQERFLRAQKMEAVGNLAGGLAHDFNNLLSVVGINAALLLDALDRTDPRRAEVQEIVYATRSGSALTRQLLAFSRRRVQQPEILDVVDAVREMEPLVRRVIGEDIELQTSYPARHGARVLADQGQLEQVILNLCVNARDAMPGGGAISIGVAVEAHEVVMEVADTGLGMSEETRARVFEPFFTTKPTGTGLGLATVYGIVEQNGGRISVESEAGLGTVFRIALPRAPEHVPPVAPATTAVAPAGRPGEVILLAEDQAHVRLATRKLLERLGYLVVEAASGAEAIKAASGMGRLDLLLTDMVMPQMRGTTLAERVRALRPDVPIVYMTGYSDDVGEAALGQQKRVLNKPFTYAALAQAVRAALDETARAGSPAGVPPG